ncbi:MAG: MAPEG family protein [Pseudomonadota bacterium]
MTSELSILAWTLALALFQIFLHMALRSRETGMGYAFGSRDEAAPPQGSVTARIQRAQANLYETLPLFAGAILVAHAAGREGAMTLLGAQLYLAGRVLYVPLYAAGIRVLRSLVWGVSLVGLVMVLFAILK